MKRLRRVLGESILMCLLAGICTSVRRTELDGQFVSCHVIRCVTEVARPRLVGHAGQSVKTGVSGLSLPASPVRPVSSFLSVSAPTGPGDGPAGQRAGDHGGQVSTRPRPARPVRQPGRHDSPVSRLTRHSSPQPPTAKQRRKNVTEFNSAPPVAAFLSPSHLERASASGRRRLQPTGVLATGGGSVT